MNFGNPEKPEIMGEFVECVRGMTEACTVLDYPVVSGNVSLYNETNGEGIYPTPAIGGVGLIKDIAKTKTIAFKQSDSLVFVIGETKGHLGNSQFLSIIQNKELGSTPIINLDNELKNGKFTLELINQNLALSTHDIGEGGLLIAAAEMSLSSNIGISINSERKNHEYFFGEDQSRYLIEIDKKNEEALNKLARNIMSKLSVLVILQKKILKLKILVKFQFMR
jgi:phosphoribosylformylglycinamidine synthase